MDKYDVRFCDCGRVHFIEEEKVQKAIENGKKVLVICNHCGESFVIGADKQINEDGNDCYMMYSYSMRDTEINDLKDIDSIVFTAGEQIRMMTGNEATEHGSCYGFIDWDTPKPDDITETEWEQKRKTVDIKSTINWIRDEEKLEEMSHYAAGINWAGTKYAKDYNSK